MPDFGKHFEERVEQLRQNHAQLQVNTRQLEHELAELAKEILGPDPWVETDPEWSVGMGGYVCKWCGEYQHARTGHLPNCPKGRYDLLIFGEAFKDD